MRRLTSFVPLVAFVLYGMWYGLVFGGGACRAGRLRPPIPVALLVVAGACRRPAKLVRGRALLHHGDRPGPDPMAVVALASGVRRPHTVRRSPSTSGASQWHRAGWRQGRATVAKAGKPARSRSALDPSAVYGGVVRVELPVEQPEQPRRATGSPVHRRARQPRPSPTGSTPPRRAGSQLRGRKCAAAPEGVTRGLRDELNSWVICSSRRIASPATDAPGSKVTPRPRRG